LRKNRRVIRTLFSETRSDIDYQSRCTPLHEVFEVLGDDPVLRALFEPRINPVAEAQEVRSRLFHLVRSLFALQKAQKLSFFRNRQRF
jgi:hypothetical protein